MMAYKKYKYKEYVRLGLYLVAVAFIGYFFFDSYSLCNDFTEKELIENKKVINEIQLDFTAEIKKEIDLNQTYGGLVWGIFINLTQIIFLVMFILILYINELIEEWTWKQ